jgi:hypothetical protein
MFDNFSRGDYIFIVVVTVGVALIAYFANRGRKG